MRVTPVLYVKNSNYVKSKQRVNQAKRELITIVPKYSSLGLSFGSAIAGQIAKNAKNTKTPASVLACVIYGLIATGIVTKLLGFILPDHSHRSAMTGVKSVQEYKSHQG